MLTHLLFSISALFFMIIFMITYFSYKKNTNTVRSKIYVYMISFVLVLTLIEIIEGVAYVYHIGILFSLMWKLHSVILILFVAALFYYLIEQEEHNRSMEELLWNSKKILSLKNFFGIIFIVMIVLSIVLIETYPMGQTMFYFYTKESINYLLILYAVYFLYNFYIVYIKYTKNNFERNDYIILGGTFVLFAAALFVEYEYSEISIYSTLFTLVLVLIYYFKENEDLIMIEELQRAQIDLYKSNEIKLNYLHELICDLESPLNTFSTINKKLEYANVLSDEQINNYLNSLNYISNNLVDILNNPNVNKQLKYRIDKLVKNIDEIVKPTIEGKPITLTYNIDPNLPSLFIGNRVSIHRIISSLLVNAIESTEVGRVILTITGQKQRDYMILNIKVSDTGKGIKKEDFNKVFLDNFFFGNNKKSDLSLTRKYVESLNGNISFDSNYGSGTIFYVNIPQRIFDETPLSQVPPKTFDVGLKDFTGKKILIIDDEEYSSKKLVSILKKYNIVTECMKSGKAAIDMFKDGGEYDLVIINDNVKDIDYREVARLLRYLDKIVKIPPLVALTINDGSDIQSKNFDDCLFKPLNLKRLVDIIEKRCN